MKNPLLTSACCIVPRTFLFIVLSWISLHLTHGQTTLLNEDFESSSGIPSGWTQSYVSGETDSSWGIANGGVWDVPLDAHSGSRNARFFYSSQTDTKRRLITPSINTTGYINISLTFWHAQNAYGGFAQDELKIFYSSNGGSTWVQLQHYTDNASEWTRRDVDIPVSGSDIRIAFEGNALWGHGVCVDDVFVTGIPDTYSEVLVTATDANASEVGPDPGAWTITRTGNTTGPLSVNFFIDGDATSGSDYNLNVTSPISFAANEITKAITLTPVDDAVGSEGDEIATITLTNGSGYVVDDLADTADISIYDDEGFDLNVLVVGSTNSFSNGGESGGESGVVAQQAFNPTQIATHLQGILSQDTALGETVNVQFQEVHKTITNFVNTSKSGTANITEHCYSLAQHYFWPDGKADRLAEFRGENGTKWDYIILCGDPYIMANFPGMYAEGVKLIKDEAARSTNQIKPEVVLLAQWPKTNTPFSIDDFNEVVHRVGGSAGLTVVPAGKVWDAYTSKDTDSAHPTPRGEYLAAASIYTALSPYLFEMNDVLAAPRSAATSDYSFASDGTNIANHALTRIQAEASLSQYSGDYDTVNVFTMKYVPKRAVSFRETGTSTEDGIRGALNRLDDVHRITFSTTAVNGRWDFNYGRGNDWWEDEKDYEVNPALYDRSYGFPMHYYNTSTAPFTMPYGIDKHYHGSTYEDGSDLGIAYNMVRPNTRETGLPEGHDVRAIPIRLMHCKMEQQLPGLNPLRDNTHMSYNLDDATASFMYTLMSGRCPLVDEPPTVGDGAWKQWLGHKIGYETAWQMSHLTTRVPGFQVRPSATSATTVTPTTTETMSVRFWYPPQENVTVTVSCSNDTAAIVGPKTLVFTPANYNVPQSVSVAGIPGASASEDFNVVFSTTSGDEIYDGLGDSWAYTTNRTTTTTVAQVDHGVTQVTALQNLPLTINLNAAGANAGNTILLGPQNGSVIWVGDSLIEYTPDNGYLGADQIVYVATVGTTQTYGCIDISVEVPDGQVNATTSDGAAAEQGSDSGTYVISRTGADTSSSLNVLFAMSGTATLGADYSLSHSSPVTIPVGQESVTITLTPVDDSTFGERYESAVLTLQEDAAYPIGAASATITITDNDNSVPEANAGPDQNVDWQDVTTVPGLQFGEVPGNIDTSTPNPETEVLVDPSSKTEDGIAGSTTEIFTGQIYDADGNISFTEHIDDKARIWVGGVLVIDNDAYGSRSSTNNLSLTPGWHDIEIRISNGTGGSGPPSGQIGIGYDPAGGTAWQVLTDPGDGSFLKANSGVAGGNTTLAGSATDAEDDPISYTWSVVSGPGNVTFGDSSSANSTAFFDAIGTYVLRLTADDGFGQGSDEVTINVQLLSNTPPTTEAGLDQTVYLNGSSAWSPSELNLQAWYDASDASTISHTGGSVSQWRNKVADIRHAAQSTGTNQPVTGSNTMNGLNVISLNGSNQFFDVDLDYLANVSHSAFIVTKASVFQNIYGAANGSAGSGSLHVGFNGSSRFRMNFWSNDFGPNTGAAFNAASGNVLNYVWQAGTSKEIFANGVSQGSNANAGDITAMAGGGRFGNVVGQGHYGGDLAEIIFITGTVSQEDREKMEGYLAHKWGLEGSLDSNHPYKSGPPGAVGVQVTLAGSVTDNEQSPTGTWSLLSGPNGASVNFSDANALDAMASFTQAGSYVLRLTGDDGYEQRADDVTITVNPALPSIYATWAGETFTQAFDVIGTGDNQDGDASDNTVEFAFGTDPTKPDAQTLASDGSAHGNPLMMEGAGDTMELMFVRRDDHGSSGSVSYTVQFSTDMENFTNSAVQPSFVADSSVDSDYEVVKVAYPVGAKFARIQINIVP